MDFFDAHTHVQFSAYDIDRDAVIRRALERGVRMVNVGTQRDTSTHAVSLAEKYDGLYATVGLHPIHTSRSYHDLQELGGEEAAKAFTSRGEVFDAAYYRKLAEHPKVVAIGECGLDYFRFSEEESRDVQVGRQKEAFRAQIALAHDVQKPLMIHCRSAFPDLIEILQSAPRGGRGGVIGGAKGGVSAGVIHFFSGTQENAAALLELGLSFTFGGVITFTHDYDEVVRSIPLDRLLSETDAPYVAPAPYRGKRNEPAYVVEIVKRLAEIKNLPFEKMAEQILANTRKTFGIVDE